MNIVTVWSKNFESLFNVFKSSLKEESMSLLSKEIDLSSYDEFGFQTDSWYKAAELKIEFLLECMHKVEDQRIVFSDCDIQFFNIDLLKMAIEKSIELNIDFFACQEPGKRMYNCGFYILSNTKKTKNFFEKVLEYCKSEKSQHAEQDFINANIKVLNHKFLYPKFGCLGFQYPTSKTCMHHAIRAFTLEEKEYLLREKYKYYFTKFYERNPLTFGDQFGELTNIKTRIEIELPNGFFYLNDPFKKKIKIL